MHRPSELCISRQTNEVRTLTSSLCLTLIKSSGLIPTWNWQLDTQEDMRKYADRKRSDAVEYKVGDLVLLSTKDLKWQMVGRRSEKLTERFVGPYRVKAIISSNAVELELSTTVKIHPVVNVSRIRK